MNGRELITENTKRRIHVAAYHIYSISLNRGSRDDEGRRHTFTPSRPSCKFCSAFSFDAAIRLAAALAIVAIYTGMRYVERPEELVLSCVE